MLWGARRCFLDVALSRPTRRDPLVGNPCPGTFRPPSYDERWRRRQEGVFLRRRQRCRCFFSGVLRRPDGQHRGRLGPEGEDADHADRDQQEGEADDARLHGEGPEAKKKGVGLNQVKIDAKIGFPE